MTRSTCVAWLIKKEEQAIGYTHYFPAKRLITDDEWRELCELVMILLTHLPDTAPDNYYGTPEVKLRLAWDENVNMPPQVGLECICFNGSDIAQHYNEPQRPPFTREPLYPDATWEKTWEGRSGYWIEYWKEFHRINEVKQLPEQGDDWGHETFLLQRHPTKKGWEGDEDEYGFKFCKTAQKPYDLAVVGVLILAEYVAPGWLDLGSDGDEDDWAAGLALVQAVIHPDIPMPGFFAKYKEDV